MLFRSNDIRKGVASSAQTAASLLRPGQLRAGSVRVPDLIVNHRDPHVVDDELTVLQVVDLQSRAIATLVSFPCHPEVVHPESHEVTADYPGHLCRLLESRYGGTALFVAGDLGGMQSPDTQERSHGEAQRFAEVLAEAVDACLGDVQSDNLDFARSTVPIELTNPMYRAVIAGGIVAPVEWCGSSVVTEVSLTRVGPVVLAGIPGELLPKLGIQLRHRLREAGARFPLIVGLADDELGYILPADDFVEPLDWDEPGRQYEESMSPGPHTGPEIMAALDELIKDVLE